METVYVILTFMSACINGKAFTIKRLCSWLQLAQLQPRASAPAATYK